MDDIREYLNKKLYNAKKTTVAIALCTAATLSMTGCGSNDLKENVNSQAQIENPIEDTLNEKNIYRLYTEKGYKDFEIRKINKCGSAQSGAIVDYYSTDGYIIAFENNGCHIFDSKNYDNVFFSFQNAYIEKLDSSLEWTPYDKVEEATNTFEYQTQTPEKSIDIEK